MTQVKDRASPLPFFVQKNTHEQRNMILDKAQIPSDIDTVEELFAWTVLILDNQAGIVEIKENDNQLPVNAVEAAILRVADNSKRFVGRVSLQLDPNYAQDNSVKIWKHIQPIVNTAIPQSFTLN